MNEDDSRSVSLLKISDLLGVGKAMEIFTSDAVETVLIETIKSIHENPEDLMKTLEKGINVKKKRFGITIAEIKIKIDD